MTTLDDIAARDASIPIAEGAIECPDCHASLFVDYGSSRRCPFKDGPGYGSCGVQRDPPTLAEAAVEMMKFAYSDRDYRQIHIALFDPLGKRLRAWPDFRDAMRRLTEGSDRT